MRRLVLLCVLVAGLVGLGLGGNGLVADDRTWFVDATAEAGLDFLHIRSDRLRHWLPEIMSGGACWLDSDGDGDLDLYLVQGGSLAPSDEMGSGRWGNALWRNDGEAGFQPVTAVAGVGDEGYGMGCAVGDIDGDGRVDLYVTNLGPNVLYRNRGDGSFERWGVGTPVEDGGWGSSAAFLDYDLDGDYDLFVVNYLGWSKEREIECFSGGLRDYCHPHRYSAPAPDRLLRNRGDGSFEDVSESAGLSLAFGNGLGVTVGDLDGDGLEDVYVANDGMANQLWLNRGDGMFRESGLVAGVAVNRVGSPEAGMGVHAFDVDGDLDLDLFVTHLRSETNTLYVNLGRGQFADRTAASGLGASSLGFTGFGTGFADFDADGLPDLLVANGRIGRGLESLTDDPFAEPDHLYRGVGRGRFELLASEAAVDAPPLASRAAALGDVDGDGDLDAVIVGSGGRARLLRNQVGVDNVWTAALPMDARGVHEIGARVTVRSPSGAASRVVQTAYGYCSANEARVWVGLGVDAEIDSIEVEPLRGRRRIYLAPPTRAVLVLPASVD